MKKLDIILFALGNFFRRKTRSALTVLGVVVGTAAVIIMLSIGFGMQEGFKDQINQWGNIKQIDVYKKWDGQDNSNNPIIANMDNKGLEAIRAIPHIAASTPILNSYYPVIKGKTRAELPINGISATDMADFDYTILYGRLLDESDIGTTNFVMTYNSPFAFNAFKAQQNYVEVTEGMELPFNPIYPPNKYGFTWDWSYGQVAVSTDKPASKPISAKCVGILAQDKNFMWDNAIYMDVNGLLQLTKKLNADQKKQQANNDSSLDGDIGIINYSYEKSFMDSSATKDIYSAFKILVDDTKNVKEVESQIRKLGYETSSSMSALNEMEKQTAFLRKILGAIGIVSFFVAALSITNTMIMSIYERTREIGIMKVMGCRLSDIRTMFLFEAFLIGIFGGIFGIFTSYGVSIAINHFAKGSGGILGISSNGTHISIIPFWLNGLALILATSVGVISGLYPAIRATKLSALEAIKNE